MGLFTRRSDAESPELVNAWRGQLHAELWDRDPNHEAYVEKANELETDLAKTMLAQKRVKDPVPVRARAVLNQMLGYVVPDSDTFPLIADAATTAFLLAHAETWDGFRSEEMQTLIDSGCAASAARVAVANEPRFRTGSALFSVLDLHPDRVPGNSEFLPLYDHIMEQPSHGRLAHLQRRRASLDRAAFGFGDLASEELAAFDLRHARAWNVGVCVWLFRECELL
jgi:hypothetical protein